MKQTPPFPVTHHHVTTSILLQV